MDLFVLLGHLLALAAHAPIETGIVLTNAWLVKATYTAIPSAERPHNRLARAVSRRRRPRADLITVELAVINRHRAKFHQG
jgi:hypothetical protein